MLSDADKVFIGKKSLVVAEMLEAIPKEMEEASQIVHTPDMLDGYKEQMSEYKAALRYFRRVFYSKHDLSDDDVLEYTDLYRSLEATEYYETYYNKETLTEQDLFGRLLS